MNSAAHALRRSADSVKKTPVFVPVVVSSQTEERTVAPVNPGTAAELDSRAPNPLWVITIGMAVFFGFTALLMIAG